MRLTINDRVGPYEVLGPLGSGGMGEVYRARDGRLGRDVALKILPHDLSTNVEALRRFELEARAASALNHPNIVTIYEIEREDSMAWIAMELIEGEDLGSLIDREPMSVKNALRIALKIAEGLAAAHERGIVHRDLKPDNVMITRDGFVKILDFGLAKQIRLLTAEDSTVPHTSPGAVFGTVGYMAPEQAAGRDTDYRSDQFSFGVMLYELLARRRPFDRETKAETLAAIIREDPPPPSSAHHEIPEELDRLVMRCLQKEPRARYASTRDLAHDLREIRDRFSHGWSTNRSGREATDGKPRSGTMVATGLIAVAVLGSAYAMWYSKRSAARQSVESLAVMPFRDLSSTPEGRMLADGISEMVAARLAEVPEIRVSPPFEGAPVEGDDVRAIARRKGVAAVVGGSVQRSGTDVRVTYSLVGAGGDILASGNATRAATELFALEDAVAEDLIAELGRRLPVRRRSTTAALAPQDQKRFVEAVGLLQRMRDEQSVDRAIAALEGILRNTRDSAQVNAQLARALLFKASLARRPALIEQAVVYATRAATLDPNDPESHVTLGMLHNASGRSTDAVRSFERALALHAGRADAMVGIAEAFEGMGRMSDAEAMYRKAIALRPDAPGALMSFGGFCYGQGRYEEAATQFRRATDLLPNYAQAWANLSGALHALGRYDEALAASKKSIEIMPTAAGLSNLGTLQFALGRYDEARQSYERATQLTSSDPVIWMNLGDARRAAKSPDAKDAYARAIETSRAALVMNPNDARTYARIALCLAKSGRAAEAQKEIRRALEIDPTSPSVLYNAAVVDALRGNEDGAISWLERAITNGYPAVEASKDPELESLRDLPSFRTALKSKS